jgi:hypothetical protein
MGRIHVWIYVTLCPNTARITQFHPVAVPIVIVICQANLTRVLLIGGALQNKWNGDEVEVGSGAECM